MEANAAAYDDQADDGEILPIYQFGEGVLEGDDMVLDADGIGVPGFTKRVNLDLDNPYNDMV